MSDTILAIELENGKFTGVSSNTPDAFDDIDVVVMNRETTDAEATVAPLAAFNMTPTVVETVDADDGVEEATFSVGRATVAPSAWALETMLELVGGDKVADGDVDDVLEEVDVDADIAA